MTDLIFGSYWAHRAAKQKAANLPRPVLRCFETNDLDETETVYLRACRSSRSILEIGAGDNRVKRKFAKYGYNGSYATFDLSREFKHDYYSLADVSGTYDSILLLDVIEHMPLGEFYSLMERVADLLAKTGVVVVSTPNPACINSMWGGDMTHVQQYPLNDLIAFFMLRNFTCEGYRVVYTKARLSLVERFRFLLKRIVAANILGADYADGLIVIAKRQGAE
jgi:Methyltransferase domain